MSETCPSCKKGRLTFFDGATEHEPVWVCSNCGKEFKEEPCELKDAKRKKPIDYGQPDSEDGFYPMPEGD